jgi:hypothetical protein
MAAKDAAPKSAYELAMERLTAQDRAAGIEKRVLSDDQKKRIADLRLKAKASLAELEILRAQSITDALGDPEKLTEINDHYETDRRRVESRLEDAVAGARDETD